MVRFLRVQVISALTLLILGSFVIFSVVSLAPGDPLSVLLGNSPPSPERVAQLRATYHLDEPFLNQYLLWLEGVVRGDFGRSTVYQEQVSTLIGQALPITLQLMLYTEIIIIIMGVGAAALSTRYPGLPDTVITTMSSVGVAIPTFVAASVLSLLLTVETQLFPGLGIGEGVWDRIWHLTLPAFSLAIAMSALLARVGRASMQQEMASGHVEAERSRGVPMPRIMRRHVLRNAAPPMLSVIGLQVPRLVAGAVIVETVFGLGGMGSLLINGVNANDFPVVQAVALMILVFTVISGIAVDLVSRVFDPRLRTVATS